MNLDTPTPRAALGMCAVDNKLVIFGGRDTEGRRNDLHVFDTGLCSDSISLSGFILTKLPTPMAITEDPIS